VAATKVVPLLPEASLAPHLVTLYERQRESWQDFAEVCKGLADVRQRHLVFYGAFVEIQYNPRRLENITASTASPSNSPDKCFLCAENIPAAQISLPLSPGAGEFLLLCNIRPIFPYHFTIVHRAHIPQRLGAHFSAFLGIARGIAPDFWLFFNGAQSGASLPHHLHWQALPSRYLPLSRAHFIPCGNFAGVEIALLEDEARQALSLVSADAEALARAWGVLVEATNKRVLLCVPEDGLFNIFATFAAGYYRLIIFPRARMRPSCYYADEPERMIISPGSVEMAGCIVTARQSDFDRLNAAHIEQIYRDVSITKAEMNDLLKSLTGRC